MNARVEQFIANLAKTFGHTQTQLNEMWEQTDVVVVEKNAEKKKCTFTLTQGINFGKECGKAVKKGGDLCTMHSKKMSDKKKTPPPTGDEDKKVKKTTPTDKKLSEKKWEDIFLSQIPQHFADYYREDKRFVAHVKLTRTTANNAAAWINGGELCEALFREKYSELPGGKADFRRRMRDSLVMAHIHPTDKMAQYHVDRLCNTLLI